MNVALSCLLVFVLNVSALPVDPPTPVIQPEQIRAAGTQSADVAGEVDEDRFGFGGFGGQHQQDSAYECGRRCGKHVDRCPVPCEGGFFKFHCIMCIGIHFDDCVGCFVRHERTSASGGNSLFGGIPQSGLGLGGFQPGFGGK